MDDVDLSEVEAGSVAAHVRRLLGSLPPAELRAARGLLAAYPVAGLETVARFAQRVGVSPPTVVRFVARLGFADYAEFQQRLRHEVAAHMGSPLAQYAQGRPVPEGSALLPYVSETFARTMQLTFEGVPSAEFAGAVALLCDSRRRVRLLGGRFSRCLSAYLATHLHVLRPDVHHLEDEQTARLAAIADLRRGDVLVVFDYRRYDQGVVHLARLAANNGAVIVLCTDPWLSPAADVARHVLCARVESPSPFDSLVPAMALVEGLIAGVTEALGEVGRRRVEQLEGAQHRPAGGRALPPTSGPPADTPSRPSGDL